MIDHWLARRSRKQLFGLFLIILLAFGGCGTLLAIVMGVPHDIASLIGPGTVLLVFVVCVGILVVRTMRRLLNTD